ncbi:FKBP-type peptidyl-prolyl cis-trans isomerase [Pseudomonas sp. nanlin1]|uniref:FKBP-type peptidyl-prolyl cis-trans isomerase n=1 Tax=Pseudomonas sp. nanlin1 TaxID=3040605 RepID=UPI00388FCF7A
MSRYLLFSCCFAMSLAHAGDTGPAATPHELSYSLGASLGERLRQEMPDLEVQALIDGLSQAYRQQPLALTDARMEQVLKAHDAQAGQQAQVNAKEEAIVRERRFMAGERAKSGVREVSEGVLVSELKPGNGAKPTPSGRVQVRYKGMLPDGTVFDENQQAQWFKLDSVIQGWQAALVQMPMGAKWRVVIGSAQAYGEEGAGDVIAPYTPLGFEIELLGTAD